MEFFQECGNMAMPSTQILDFQDLSIIFGANNADVNFEAYQGFESSSGPSTDVADYLNAEFPSNNAELQIEASCSSSEGKTYDFFPKACQEPLSDSASWADAINQPLRQAAETIAADNHLNRAILESVAIEPSDSQPASKKRKTTFNSKPCSTKNKKHKLDDFIVVFGLENGAELKPRKRKRYDQARRTEVALNRRIGACLSCRLRKRPVRIIPNSKGSQMTNGL